MIINITKTGQLHCGVNNRDTENTYLRQNMLRNIHKTIQVQIM